MTSAIFPLCITSANIQYPIPTFISNEYQSFNGSFMSPIGSFFVHGAFLSMVLVVHMIFANLVIVFSAFNQHLVITCHLQSLLHMIYTLEMLISKKKTEKSCEERV